MRILTLVCIFLFGFTCVNAVGAQAAESVDASKSVDTSKKEVVAAWELSLRALPSTKVLEKATDPNIYNFESSLIPFKGQIKILNVIVSDEPEFYALNLESDVSDVFTKQAFVEVALIGVSSTYWDDMPRSYQAWKSLGEFFYVKEKNMWLARDAAKLYGQATIDLKDAAKLREYQSTEPPSMLYEQALIYVYPILCFMIFFGIVQIFSRKKRLQANEFVERTRVYQQELVDSQKAIVALLQQMVAKEK